MIIEHTVKSVRNWSFSGPYFPAFGLDVDQKNSEYGHLGLGFLGLTVFFMSKYESDIKNYFDVIIRTLCVSIAMHVLSITFFVISFFESARFSAVTYLLLVINKLTFVTKMT